MIEIGKGLGGKKRRREDRESFRILECDIFRVILSGVNSGG